MEITAQQVNELRKQTGAGLMDCKKALQESNGDMEAAIDFLRKKGQKVSAQRADREAKEGVVIAQTNDNGKTGVIVNLACETDFVAKNEEFISFAQSIADNALKIDVSDLEGLLEANLNGSSLKNKLTDQVGKIGEKIEVTKYEKMEGDCIIPYIHAGYKIGVLVALNQPKSDAVQQIGKDIAMQIAAMSPIAVDKDDVEQSVVDRELDIAREQVRAEGKPEDMIDKIAMGKLNKFYKENTLLNQQFVKDGSKTVNQVLKELDPNLTVVQFKRIALGS